MKSIKNSCLIVLIFALAFTSYSNNLKAQELTTFYENNKAGLRNSKGIVVLQPLLYDDIKSFNEGLALVITGGKINPKFGFINKTGKIVIELKYDVARDFSEGLAIVGLGDFQKGETKYGFIDKTGKVVIELQYNSVRSFSEGLAVATFSEGIWPALKNVKNSFIDKTGIKVFELPYELVGNFKNGLAKVGQGGYKDGYYKYGFINKSGVLVIPILYHGVEDFDKEVAEVKIRNEDYDPQNYSDDYHEKQYKVGSIDKTGKVVVPIK